ncbi:TPA: hypothetical protein ACGEYZ_005168, partial [Klebsiella pneumoniae]
AIGSINAKDKSIFLKESSSTLFQPIRPESSRLPESLLLGNNQDPPRLMWVKAGTQHESAFHLPSVVGTGLLLKECASSCERQFSQPLYGTCSVSGLRVP